MPKLKLFNHHMYRTLEPLDGLLYIARALPDEYDTDNLDLPGF
jgi:hypothetical protein